MEVIHDPVLSQLARNGVIWVCFTAWAVAQSVKVLLGIIREKRFNFRWFVGSGGMPSSHAAAVSCIATSVGLYFGFHSPFFATVCVFAFIIMFDAQGVRRQSGQQAEALNHILDDIYAQRGLRQERLKELFGHTPVEVLAGALIGIFVAMALL